MRISDWSSDVCSSDLEDELVRVVRHVQFLFADQLEIVALERTIEDERIVKRRRTGGTRIGRVEGKAWRQLHAALTGLILPGTSPRIRVARRIDDRNSVAEGKSVSVRVDIGGDMI